MKLLPDPLPSVVPYPSVVPCRSAVPCRSYLWLVVASSSARQGQDGTPHAASEIMLDLIARLVQHGPVHVIDGNNRFNAHYCSRVIAHNLCFDNLSRASSLSTLLSQIYVARAFTCYQMLTLLSEMPSSPAPTVALDFLATFYDENVPATEAQRLLETCVAHLRRLSAQSPVLVGARLLQPRQLSEDRSAMLDILAGAAQRVWTLEAPSVYPSQLSFSW